LNMDKDIISVLSDPHAQFSKRQRTIARFICDNFDRAAFMTAEKLSEAAGVSESTVVRFATELGFSGYPQMRRELQHVLRSRLSNLRIGNDDEQTPAVKVMRSSLGEASYAVELASNSSNEREFAEIVSAVGNAKRIYVAGYADLAALGAYAEYSLGLIRDCVYAINGDIDAKLSRIHDGDILLALCPKGAANYSLPTLRFAKDRMASVVVIGANELSEEAAIADHCLSARCSAVVIAFIDALTAALEAFLGGSISDTKKELRNICSEYKVYEHYND